MWHVGGKSGPLGIVPPINGFEVKNAVPSSLVLAAKEFLGQLDIQPQSREIYRRHLKSFLIWANERSLENPKRDDLLAYKQYLRKFSAYTQSGYLAIAVRFVQHLNPNARLDIRGIPINRGHRRDPLTLEQARTLLSSVDVSTIMGLRDRAILTLMLHGALRTIEVVRATAGDIVTHSSGEKILRLQGKAHFSKDEFCVLPENVYTAIMEYLNARGRISDNDPLFTSCSDGDIGKVPRPLSTRATRRLFRKRLIEAKIFNRRITAHSARNSSIDYGLLAGASIQEVASFCRHKSIEVTNRYASVVNRVKNPVEKKIAKLLANDATPGGDK